MTQKIIRIGSRAGITIPKKELERLGLKVGDKVNYVIEPVKGTKHTKLMSEYDRFISLYGDDLKNLADR